MYICSNCGYGSASWLGKCPSCEEWNTFVQQADSSSGSGRGSKSKGSKVTVDELSITPLSTMKSLRKKRMPTGLGEFDRVLGGGFVEGEVVLLTGEPGIGKSTLLLQALQHFRTLYISGEEAGEQIKERADRIGIGTDKYFFSNTLQLEGIVAGVKAHAGKYEMIVIDSIQTLYSQRVEGQPGSVSQMRELTYQLTQLAKETKIPMIIVGHVTKGGDVAGPKTLEHIVDAVLLFEGEKVSQYRVLRNQKNRFSSTDDIGIFAMAGKGLEEMSESIAFIDKTVTHVPGKATAGIIEGNRPLFFEVQTLVVPTSLPMPRRVVKGLDYNKLLLLLAVLRKHLNLNFDAADIYVNVVGGLTVKSPAADLATIASIISSLKNIPLSNKTVYIGEVGLLGEVRTIPGYKTIASEGKRLQFTNVKSHEEVKDVKALLRSLTAE